METTDRRQKVFDWLDSHGIAYTWYEHPEAPTIEAARRYCHTQGAQLPTDRELEMGESSGVYHGGIEMRAERLYHTQDSMLYVPQLSGDERLLPNRNLLGSNGHYYCVRKKASARK